MPLEELLRQKYLVEGIPVYKIAEEFGVSHTTVHRWIRQFRLHYKKPIWNKGLTKEEMQRIIELNTKR
jgi:transposase